MRIPRPPAPAVSIRVHPVAAVAVVAAVAAVAGIFATCATAFAAPPRIDIDRPGQREFVLDLADVLEARDRTWVRTECARLSDEKAVPIVVVTIASMARHGGAGSSIEEFAARLFDQWGIGDAALDGAPWNRGILLLVSVGDRKARIEMGGGWRGERDAECRRIMETRIVPRFREARYADGIRDGVAALATMVRHPARRSLPLPGGGGVPREGLVWLFLGLAGLGASCGSLALWNRNRRAWYWAILAAPALLLVVLARSSDGMGWDDSSSGGSSSGGSFGGGSSGGGGATGSW